MFLMRNLCLSLILIAPLLHASPTVDVANQPASINPVEEKVFIIDALLWARPRTGEAVSAMPPLRNAVQSMLNTPGSRLAVRYPGGDAGGLWAEELFDWLISLGIEADMIVMQPGSAFEDRIELRVIVH
jgi:phage baseplate assembly protein W